MPVFSFTKTYADDQALFELDLDNLRESIEEAINTTGLDYQNFQSGGISASSFKDPGIFVQSGTVVAYPSATPPTGWLSCDGSSQLVASYPNLFAAIGYTYGGAGPNFNLPDTQERLSVGMGNMGGASAANRITVGVTGMDTTVAASTGGDETLPAHTHDGSLLTGASGGSHSHSHSTTHFHAATINGYSASSASADNEFRFDAGFFSADGPTTTEATEYIGKANASSVSVQAASGTHSHSLTGSFGANSNSSSESNGVVQPVIVLNKIIKT